MKAFCEKCQSPQPITPTGEKIDEHKGTSQWWTLDLHKYPEKPELCPGSGKRV